MTTWQEVAGKALTDAYPADMKADELLRKVREAGFPSTAKSTLYLWLKARATEGTVDHVAHGRYQAGKAVMEPGRRHSHVTRDVKPQGQCPGCDQAREDMKEDGSEAPPEALRDLIGAAAGVMIPAGVISTWTPAERKEAEEWAASEHLRASDNTGIRKMPYPRIVQEAVVLAANPGMAQLAVEAWMQRKESIERELAARGEHGSVQAAYAGSVHRETVEIAQAAITGLLVLLDGEAGPASPWVKALSVLGAHPEGIAARDLSVLLGKNGPGKEALDEWLEAGLGRGALERVGYDAWRIRGAGG